MGKVKNLIGKRFGKLTVIEQHGFTKKNKHGSRQAIWYCKCDCGNYCEMASGTLTRKQSNHSCGCLAKEHLKDMANKNITHGMSNTGIYRSYKAMMNRCYRKNDIHFNAYGKRGISVCDEWKGHPKTFIEWGLQHGWKEHLTLERINVNGNYEPTNCKWIPMSEQYKNKQSNHNKGLYHNHTKKSEVMIMTYRELLYKAQRLINNDEITLGEYDEMTKPLNEEIRKIGKWIIDDKEQGRIWHCHCSNCKKDPQDYIGGTENWWLVRLPNCCPNCGAIMEGNEND